MRLALTITLVVLVMATLKVYEKEGTVGMDAKTAFNVIITVLSLALGLNFLEAFKDMAKVLRWRVLAKTSFTVREADLILGGESLMKLLRLMWESPKKPMTLFVCALWYVIPGPVRWVQAWAIPLYPHSPHICNKPFVDFSTGAYQGCATGSP